ncbi:hypothetical protein CAPN004_13650 [Capnocytophaga cynodegmi]|uniref:hypothetical protein n=1 Tax=Capnocytophaga cynodegmi TaxID=28189 RepID=UPI001AD30908|nr:hypothetical protein [Capnocytophaga cynodegmi]GIM52335.1 hypothetical protein CAPN004_13650 [Capnocytophaga cynodegmi]
MKNYQKIPQVDEERTNKRQEQIQSNYKPIIDIVELIKNELKHIESDPDLTHLIRGKR